MLRRQRGYGRPPASQKSPRHPTVFGASSAVWRSRLSLWSAGRLKISFSSASRRKTLPLVTLFRLCFFCYVTFLRTQHPIPPSPSVFGNDTLRLRPSGRRNEGSG